MEASYISVPMTVEKRYKNGWTFFSMRPFTCSTTTGGKGNCWKSMGTRASIRFFMISWKKYKRIWPLATSRVPSWKKYACMAVMRKSVEERNKIRETGRIVSDILAELRMAVHPGVTTGEIDAIAVAS